MQYFESAACWSAGRACRGSSSPKTIALARPRASSPTCGSSPFTTTVASPGSARRPPPALGDELELAVAVELVAEEVAEADRARPHARARPPAAPPRPPRTAPARRRAAASSAEATPETRFAPERVVREPEARREDLGRHRRRRRLAVRRRDERRSRRKPRGQPVDRARVELPEQLARHRRAAARAGEARQPRGGRARRRSRRRAGLPGARGRAYPPRLTRSSESRGP